MQRAVFIACLCEPARSHPQRGPCSYAPARTPREDSQHSMASILVRFSASYFRDSTLEPIPKSRAPPSSPSRAGNVASISIWSHAK